MEEKVTVSFEDSKIKTEDRSRGRMKITIKLSKEEATGFKNFMKVKPETMPEEMFFKQIFFEGCNSLTAKIQQMMIAHQQREAEKAQSSGLESQLNQVDTNTSLDPPPQNDQ